MDPDRWEELFAHEGWLRALARDLMGEPDEDLVQDVWVVALRKPLGEIANLRAWLRSVARRLASRRFRDRGRERRTNRAPEETEELLGGAPQPDEILEREELRTELTRVVVGLREPYRDVLLLYYYEGLSVAAIAHRLNLEVPTVNTRLFRGRDDLRRRLSETEHGDRSLWALLPAFVGADRAATTVTTAVATGGGVALALGLVVACLAVREASVVVRGGGATPPDAVLVTSVPEGRSGLRPPAATGREDAGPEPGGAAPRRLAVDVRDATSGRPLADRGVELAVHAGSAIAGEPLLSVERTSGDDGVASFELPESHETLTLAVRPAPAHGAGSPVLPSGPILVRVARGRDPPRVPLYLSPADTALAVRVTDLDGRPVPGATVFALGTEHPVGAAGVAEVRTSSHRRGPLRITASAPGRARATVVVGEAAAGAVEVPIRLGPPLPPVVGRVVAADGGRPLEGAEVRFLDPANRAASRTARTGPDGRFRLEGAEGDAGRIVLASAPGYGGALGIASGEELELALAPVVARPVRLVDPDGAPIAAARLVVGASASDALRWEGWSAGDGSCALAWPVPPGAAIFVHHREYVPRLFAPEDVGEVVVLQPRSTREEGTVLDGAGRAVAGASITVSLDGFTFAEVALSDGNGGFALRGPMPEGAQLEVAFPGHPPLEMPWGTFVAEGRLATLADSVALAGTVVAAESGAPIESFAVRIRLPPEGRWLHGSSQGGIRFRDGRFELREVLPGVAEAEELELEIEVGAQGRLWSRRTLVVGPRTPPPDLEIRLAAAPSAEGLALDARTGAPVAGARVTVDPAPLGAVGVETDGEGRFSHPVGGAGPCHVVVVHPDYAPLRLGPIHVSDAGPLPALEAVLRPGAVVEVVVRHDGDQPIAGAHVELAGAGGWFRWREVTDERGSATFRRVPPGACEASWWRHEEGEPVPFERRPLDVAAEGTETVTLGPTGSGALLVELGEPRSRGALRVTVEALDPAGTPSGPAWERVAPRGTVEVAGLAAARYRVSVRGVGLSRVLEVELADGERRAVRL